METIQLYKQDAYHKTFKATVLQCEKEKEYYQIALDQTAFFPEGGGQYGDRGFLDEVIVFDTQIKDGVVYHKTKEPIEEGREVIGTIDWERRYCFMQNHSAEHMMSGFVHRHYGYQNVGFHLGEEEMTMDFDGILTMEQLLTLEKEVNEAIWENKEVVVSYPTKEELETIDYRSKKEIEGDMRIVTIDGVDCCACCAPHVQKTGEIGLAKVISVQKNKTGVRVTMLAGRWALQDYGKKQEEVHEISKMLSAKVGEVAKTVAKLKEEKEKLEYELVALRLQMIQQKAEQTPIVDGIACMETEGLSGKEVREVCNCLMEKAEIGVVLNRKEKDEEEFQYSIGSKEQDVRKISILLKEQLSGRGGGQPKMIQGTAVGTKAQVEKVLMDWREQRDE